MISPPGSSLRFALIIRVVQLFTDVTCSKSRRRGAKPRSGFLRPGDGYARLRSADLWPSAGQNRHPVVVFAFFLGAVFAPCVFRGGFTLVLVGMVLWGIGMGVRDSRLKAMFSGVVPPGKRSTAVGAFDTVLGVAWFAGRPGWDGCTTNPSPV